MAVSCVYIKFFNSQKSFSFLSNAPLIIKLKFWEIKNTVRMLSRMKLTTNPVFLQYFSKFMGILLFVFKNNVYFLASEDDKWVFLSSKIMVSPFKRLWGTSPSEVEKNCKSIRTIWCIPFAWGAHTKPGTLSLPKIEGRTPGAPPSNPPLDAFHKLIKWQNYLGALSKGGAGAGE